MALVLLILETYFWEGISEIANGWTLGLWSGRKQYRDQHRKSFWQKRNPWLGYHISNEDNKESPWGIKSYAEDLKKREQKCSQPHSLPRSVSWSRFLVRICWRRRRIFCFSSWISLSLSSPSSSSSSRHWLIMLHFISSMAAIKDSEMLKWAFSWGKESTKEVA